MSGTPPGRWPPGGAAVSWRAASKAGCTPASERALELHLRRVRAATVCGKSLGAGPTKQCLHDLTAIPTEPADKRVLAPSGDASIDRAIDVQHTTTTRSLPSLTPSLGWERGRPTVEGDLPRVPCARRVGLPSCRDGDY
ncbi:hypothetical protein BN10_140070 [Phycicoccus elongatus Lp2]|uniref:Uncharacterized protein n=1 Tax=Phycicoccus elongatus Lp2 TaxID=1193181 RepID=N0DY72_9MICO|nr:hypothetical protein BN10_140070 [Phycicoccus elongatus Lp2]